MLRAVYQTSRELQQVRALAGVVCIFRTMCYELFVKHPENISKAVPYSGFQLWLLKKVLCRVIKKEMWGHGIGRHSDEQVWDIARRDLNALSDFLGTLAICGLKDEHVALHSELSDKTSARTYSVSHLRC